MRGQKKKDLLNLKQEGSNITMDIEILKANNIRIDEALKILNKALSKEEKAKEASTEARAEVKLAKDNYALALDEAKRVIV